MLKVLLKTAGATVLLSEGSADAWRRSLARLQGACWVGEFDVSATASDLLAVFCKTYHLDRGSCTLHIQGRQLPSKQLLRKVRPVYQWLKGSKWN